jgi:hypothetical protein
MTDDEDDAAVKPAAKGRRLPVGRKAVVDKLWRAAKRQLVAHEAHLDELPKGAAASESDAKALATLARTVRELVALEAATATPEGGQITDDLSPAAGLRHVAELRTELARRLERLAAEEAGEAAAQAAPGRRRRIWLRSSSQDWVYLGAPDQKPPVSRTAEAIWLVLGGRGAGKTRTGAEWVKGMALGLPPFADSPTGRIALVGETQGRSATS